MADLVLGSRFQHSLEIADQGTNEPTYLSPILFSLYLHLLGFVHPFFCRESSIKRREQLRRSWAPGFLPWFSETSLLFGFEQLIYPSCLLSFFSYISVNRRTDGLHGLSENLRQLPYEMLLRKLRGER